MVFGKGKVRHAGTQPKGYYEAVRSYVENGGHERNRKKVVLLQMYLKRRGIRIDGRKLTKDIRTLRLRTEEPILMDRMEATLFTRGNSPRPERFRFGSDHCPSCGLHKNYEKECPHCGFHEITP